MRSAAAFFGAAPAMPTSYAYNDGMQCGAPVACRIEQPVQQVVHVQAVAPVTQTVVAVQQLQPVHQPVMQTVQAVEYRPVKQTVSKPVVTTEYVDQAVTVMQPVSELKTVNVQTVDYQTITEYKTVQKQVGYWATQNVPTNRVAAYQYDNRPNALGAINRASYNMRTAFTPQYQQVRKFVPQTMTCQVPCKRQVAVPGMKQVTYNVTKMQPMQTTRKVAVNKVIYQQAEETVMKPFQITKTVQVGTKVSYLHPTQAAAMSASNCNPSTGSTALAPTPDPKASAASPKATRSGNLDANKFGDDKGSGAVQPYDNLNQQLSESTVPAKKFVAASKPEMANTAIRTSVWVARNSSPSKPQSSGKSAAISIADTSR